jgi:Endoribonuclease GhoS
MARFTVRIELHNAGYADYEDLHRFMEEGGFSRTITSDDGTKHHLPTAEYNAVGDFSIDDVLAAAKKAATATRKTFGVLVSEATKRKWEGLPAV